MATRSSCKAGVKNTTCCRGRGMPDDGRYIRNMRRVRLAAGAVLNPSRCLALGTPENAGVT